MAAPRAAAAGAPPASLACAFKGFYLAEFVYHAPARAHHPRGLARGEAEIRVLQPVDSLLIGLGLKNPHREHLAAILDALAVLL